MVDKNFEQVVREVSVLLREWIHDVNNALFVTKGFLEEIQVDVENKAYLEPDYDYENLVDMLRTVSRNVEKLDQNLQKLRKFAKHDIFEKNGLPIPQ